MRDALNCQPPQIDLQKKLGIRFVGVFIVNTLLLGPLGFLGPLVFGNSHIKLCESRQSKRGATMAIRVHCGISGLSSKMHSWPRRNLAFRHPVIASLGNLPSTWRFMGRHRCTVRSPA